MKNLTPAQQRVFDDILEFMFEYRRPPVYQNIADRLGCNLNNVYELVCRIEEKGYLVRALTIDQKDHLVVVGSRTIVITDQTICPYCRRGD